MDARFFLFMSLVAVATSAAAQETTTGAAMRPAAPARRQDVSLFLQSGVPSAQQNESAVVQGLMYRRAIEGTSHTFWKLGLGAGTTDYTGLQYTQPPTSDTMRNIVYNYHERIVQAMGGVETERQLWRGLYLTAGFELQTGASGGFVDSLTQTTYRTSAQTQVFTSTAARFADTRQYFGTGLGLLGIRAYAGRFTAALDVFTGVRAALLSQTLTNDRAGAMRSFSIFDFSAGGFGSKISFGYRF